MYSFILMVLALLLQAPKQPSHTSATNPQPAHFRAELDRPLFIAIFNGDYEQVKKLLDQGANPNAVIHRTAQDKTWDTKYFSRVAWGNKRRISMNFDGSWNYEIIQPTVASFTGWTVLDLTLWLHPWKLARLLLDRGATPTPGLLKWTVRLDDLDIVRYVIRKGAKADKQAMTEALFAAIEAKSPKMINFMLDHGADINVRVMNGRAPLIGETPLMAAVFEDYAEGVTLLLKRGADVNVKTEEGFTALKIAEMAEGRWLVPVLVKAGAKE